jgi:C4-type Zn-finger protein
MPEIESKIESGALSLSAVTQVYGAVRGFKKTESRENLVRLKRELLEKFENTTARERDEVLAEMFPQVSFIKEQIKPIGPDRVEIKLAISRELADKIERLREVTVHQNREQTLEGLLEKLVELGLKKSDPLYKPIRLAQ